MPDIGHAYLSASASDRWTHCPPSAKLNAEATERASPYAMEGTCAHSLCEYLVLIALGRTCKDPTGHLEYYDSEMQEAAESYRDFFMEQIAEAKTLCQDPVVCVEQRVDFSRWVPGGFGTADGVIVTDGFLQIIDMKYGVGVLVSAERNSQLSCYAIAGIDMYDGLYDIQKVKLSIFQPRREHYNTWETTKDELLLWAEKDLAPAAQLAIKGEGEFSAGDHCRFCKVKDICRARAEHYLELAGAAFNEPDTLDSYEIAALLPRLAGLVSWADDLKEYALRQAITGTKYPGFKIVEGRSVRRYVDDEAVAETVSKAGFDPFEKKVLGITAMTKRLGKKRFDELLGALTVKPQGKPVLAPESDKRPEMHNIDDAFNEDNNQGGQ